MTSAAYAYLLMVSISGVAVEDTSCANAPESATQNAADDPSPAPMGKLSLANEIASPSLVFALRPNKQSR